MSLHIETEENNEISFLDVNAICEQTEFITRVYQKPTFSGAYNHFDHFLPDTYKIGMIYILVNRCFSLVNIPSTIDIFKRDISEKWLSRKLH